MADHGHVLLTALGKSARETTYELGGRTAVAKLAPLALVQLLDDDARPQRVVALVTQGAAETTWPLFQEAIQSDLGIEPEPVEIPNGVNTEEIGEILERCAESLKNATQVTIDVTQGLRHFPFIVYALALYLRTLREVPIRAVYYGMFESEGDVKPIIDLQPLLTLPDWVFATRVFCNTGATGPMADLVDTYVKDVEDQARKADNDPSLHRQAAETRRLVARLRGVSFAYESGMPLELGKLSFQLHQTLTQGRLPEVFANTTPLAAEIAAMVSETANALAFNELSSMKGNWKERVSLDESELERQARLIEQYLGRDQIPLAMGLMQEWVVSWVIHKEGTIAKWLNFKPDRRKAAGRLTALDSHVAASNDSTDLTESQKQWGTFWGRLTELRNTLHHHGMRAKAIESRPEMVSKIVTFWNAIRSNVATMPELGGGTGQLLITPIGNRPGVLFSAIRITEPDRCLAICSEQSSSHIDEAIRCAEFEGELKVLVIADPFSGFDQLPALVESATRWLLEADTISASLTGGTTLMGIAVQQLVDRAQKLAKPTRRLVLVDRRSPEEQDRDPFTLSAHQWLDPQEDNEDGQS